MALQEHSVVLAQGRQWVLLCLSWERQQELLLGHCWDGLLLALQQVL
ncbi:hypothetical protein [Serratia fonticola]